MARNVGPESLDSNPGPGPSEGGAFGGSLTSLSFISLIFFKTSVCMSPLD